jgi:hypothetical protein
MRCRLGDILMVLMIYILFWGEFSFFFLILLNFSFLSSPSLFLLCVSLVEYLNL